MTRIHNCNVTFHDQHDAMLYRAFYNEFIVNDECTICDVYDTYIIARFIDDDDDIVCVFNDDRTRINFA
jgi:hypothetical protein